MRGPNTQKLIVIFVQERLLFKEIYPKFVSFNDQLVDILTTSLSGPHIQFI